MKILVLGVGGMLGHKVFEGLLRRDGMEVMGTIRSLDGFRRFFPPDAFAKIKDNVDAGDFDTVQGQLNHVKPDVVINCIGIIKQLPQSEDPVVSININSLFPHRLARACKESGARLIHISTDCVFSGEKGNYTEDDRPDAVDLYGLSKLMGEVPAPNLTLRTSLIGHELSSRHGLTEWFLSQEGKVKGFARAIFSGFPTVEMARILADYVIPNRGLAGLYHVSSEPISKYDLLRLISEAYGKSIEIERKDEPFCDRSLDSTRFRKATGYCPPSWPKLVEGMHIDALNTLEA